MTSSVKKVLVSDKLAEEGIRFLENSPGIEVTFKTGMPEDELCRFIKGFHGLIIRSATKVTERVIENADSLQVVARAGVGVDNVNIPAASKKGIVVMNAPGGNSVSTAEHTISMLMALSRHIPQANQSIKEKKWQKKMYMGTEVTNKTLGVIGLGRIGKEVVKRAVGLKMKVVGYDPYIPKEKLTHLDLDVVELEELLQISDYITAHTPLNEQTKDIVNMNNLHILKSGVRIINVARGGIFDEQALHEGLNTGKIAGVALDVFTKEPPTEIAVVDHPKCIATPHLGASTDEAQLGVALETAEEVVEFFSTGVARNSLNFPTIDPEDMQVLGPWFKLSERMGSLLAKLTGGKLPQAIRMQFYGDFQGRELDPIKIGFYRGLLAPVLSEPTNYVNAPMFAKEHGIQVSLDLEDMTKMKDYTHLLEIRAKIDEETFGLMGTIINGIPNIISLQEFPIEFRLEGIILVIQNRDIPNMVGTIGTFIGSKNINIARLELARKEKGSTAYTALSLDSSLNESDIKELRSKEGILDAFQVDFG